MSILNCDGCRCSTNRTVEVLSVLGPCNPNCFYSGCRKPSRVVEIECLIRIKVEIHGASEISVGTIKTQLFYEFFGCCLIFNRHGKSDIIPNLCDRLTC